MTTLIYFGFKEREYAEGFEDFLTHEHNAKLVHTIRTGHEVVDLYHLPQNCKVTYLWGINQAGGDTKVFFTGNDDGLVSLVQQELQRELRVL